MTYRKIDVKIWGDERFRRLSVPKPNGRDCFTFLLTAPQTIILPGAIPSGPAALAESIRWTERGFRRAFSELEREGLALADWQAGLIWIPKAIRYNHPGNPNVANAWGKAAASLPDCGLKGRVRSEVEVFLFTELGAAYREAFTKAGGFAFESRSGVFPAEAVAGSQKPKTEAVAPIVVVEKSEPVATVLELQPVKAEKRERKASRQEALFAALAEERRQALGDDWTEDTYSSEQINTMLKHVVDFAHPATGDGYRDEAIVGAFGEFLRNAYYATHSPPFRIRVFASRAVFSEHLAKFNSSSAADGAGAWG
jgi:hypothetical protein